MKDRESLAEFLGTSLLLYVVVGSGIVVARGTSDSIVQLLAHSVMVGLGLAVLIALFSGVSGAHFNPVVTLAIWRRSAMDGPTASRYLLAQVSGGLVGMSAAHLCFGTSWSIASNSRSGWGPIASEFIGTLVLVLLIVGLINRAQGSWVPAAVGAWITVMIFSTASSGFLNPAVTIARMFTDTYTGISPGDAAAFVGAQFVGAVLAGPLASRLFPGRPAMKGT